MRDVQAYSFCNSLACIGLITICVSCVYSHVCSALVCHKSQHLCSHLETWTLYGSFGSVQLDTQEALVKKAMTTKFPSTLILLELAEELAFKSCELGLTWIRRDANQLADDLTNENFKEFSPDFRSPLKGKDIQWRVLDKLLEHANGFYRELLRFKRGPLKVRKSEKLRKLSPGSPLWLRVEMAS